MENRKTLRKRTKLAIAESRPISTKQVLLRPTQNPSKSILNVLLEQVNERWWEMIPGESLALPAKTLENNDYTGTLSRAILTIRHLPNRYYWV
jgi:hypothetical protein